MHFTRDMAEAFGDWLELDRIQSALLKARPELEGALILDEERPLLRIPRPVGGALLIARSGEDSTGRWIVGVPGQPEPVLHDTNSAEEAVSVTLDALEQWRSSELEDTPADGPHCR